VQLSKPQIKALPRNVELVQNDRGDPVHRDENADPAADAYAALTRDRDCLSRAKVRRFWSYILPGDLEGYGEGFFTGFLNEVALGTC
jgi:hypothetical protein